MAIRVFASFCLLLEYFGHIIAFHFCDFINNEALVAKQFVAVA
jgi:hypothetical protein